MDDAQALQVQLSSLVPAATGIVSARPSTARQLVAVPVPRARPLAAIMPAPVTARHTVRIVPPLAALAGKIRPSTARPSTSAQAIRRPEDVARTVGCGSSQALAPSNQPVPPASRRPRARSEQVGRQTLLAQSSAPSLRRSMSERLPESLPPPALLDRSISEREMDKKGQRPRAETAASKVPGPKTLKTEVLRAPAAVTTSTRRLSKGLFRRQSVAEIFQEARLMETQMPQATGEQAEAPAPETKLDLSEAAEAAAAARAQKKALAREAAGGQTSEEHLMMAAAAAAFNKIGNIQVHRTRSRSTSPPRSPITRSGEEEVGQPILRTSSRGSSRKWGRTASSDDTALEDLQKLDEIASADGDYRLQRQQIRKALQDFRPSDEDWRSIDFFRIREKEKLGDDSKKNSPPELPSEMELVPDNPDQEPGWKLVRTVFGTKKWFNLEGFREAVTAPVEDATPPEQLILRNSSAGWSKTRAAMKSGSLKRDLLREHPQAKG